MGTGTGKRKPGNPNFVKGHKRVGGRVKGTPNKFTTLKQAFLGAFVQIGGEDGLAKWAKTKGSKEPFYKMVSSMLPKDVNLTVEGAGDLAAAIKAARQRSDKAKSKPKTK